MDDHERSESNGYSQQPLAFITPDYIRNIIRSSIYRGVLRVRKLCRDIPVDAENVSEFDEFRGRHTCLVDDKEWFAANEAIRTAGPKKRSKPISGANAGSLQGLVSCRFCDCAMSAGTSGRLKKSGEPHRYYRCSQKVKGAEISPCTTLQISADALERSVVALIQAFEVNPGAFVRSKLESLLKKKDSEIKQLKEEIDKIDLSIAEEKKRIERSVAYILAGQTSALNGELVASAEASKAQIEKLENDKIGVHAQLNRLTAAMPGLSELGLAFGTIARALSIADRVAQAAIFNSLILNVEVERCVLAPRAGEANARGHRHFRLRVHFRTNSVLNFGKTRDETLTNLTRYGNVIASVTIEVHSNKNRQQVLLLEHAYTVESASYKPAVVSESANSRNDENPIQRACRWRSLLADDRITAVALAESEKVSPGLISQYLRLLELPESIVDFLRAGRDGRLKKPISLRELQRLESASPQEAVDWFHQRIAGAPLQETLTLKC